MEFFRCGQTCGQKPFQISGFEKSREKSVRAATVFRIADFFGKIGSVSTQIGRCADAWQPDNVRYYTGLEWKKQSFFLEAGKKRGEKPNVT